MKTKPMQSGRLILTFAAVVVLAAWSSPAAPANDMFANRTVITGTNVTVTGSSVGATKEAGERTHAGNAGGASVWWSWTAPYNGFATITTAGSDFDTLLAVYRGSSVSALSWVLDNDDESYSISTSRVYVEVAAGEAYQIAVDGYAGASGNVQLHVEWEPFPIAAAWTLLDPYGATVSSSSYAGKVVIFDFWATWCGPCKVEIPDLVYLQDKYRADGLVVVGPSLDSTSPAVINFLATNSPALNYQVVMCDSATQQAYGGIGYIPTTFIMDRQNIIRKKYVGTQTRNTFEQQIIPLLYRNTCLSCQKNGLGLSVRWATNALPFTLESATNANQPVWSAWPTSPTVVNGTNILQVPSTGAPRYFRLRMSY
jgi:thiol-disulfide isomerase/thioredoxin